MYLNDADEENLSKVPTTLFVSEGYKYLRQLKFGSAISAFEKILERDPKNIKSLLGRAKCYMRLARYKEAWHDFQQVINLNPKCTEAVYLKGVTEYLRGDFERSFITYWEGHKVRPSCDELRQGHELSKTAIEKNLNADIRMLLTGKDVDKIAQVCDEDKKMKYARDDFDNKGLFSSDLKLLHDLTKDKNLTLIHSMCKDLFEYVRERQKFWKMHETYRSKYKSSSTAFVKNNTSDLTKMNLLARNFGLCKMAFKEGKSKICINKGTEALKILNTMSSKQFPERNEIEAETLHYLGMTYLAEKDFSSALKYCEQQLNIVTDSNLFQFKERALRDLGEINVAKLKYENALLFFEKSLPFAKTEDSKAILLYKISDCNVHLNNLEIARDTAKRCLEIATRSLNLRLQFDTLMLLAEAAVKGKDMKVAEQYYKSALQIAITNNDSRQKDLKILLEIFEELATKESYSNERIKITKISDIIKLKANYRIGNQ